MSPKIPRQHDSEFRYTATKHFLQKQGQRCEVREQHEEIKDTETAAR